MHFNILDTSFQVSRKPPITSKKQKLKEPQVLVVKSDDGNLSSDTSKHAKRKKKKAKTSDAISQPKAAITKVPTKKPVVRKVLAKTTYERLESDNFSPGAEGSKVKNLTLLFVNYFIPSPFDYSSWLNFLLRVTQKLLGNRVPKKLFM